MNMCICAFIFIHYNYMFWVKMCVSVCVCVCVHVFGRKTQNQRDDCDSSSVPNFFFGLCFCLSMKMFILCSLRFMKQKCVCKCCYALLSWECVCVCLHDCLQSDLVSFIYFSSSLFTRQSDVGAAHVHTDLNRHIIWVMDSRSCTCDY